MEQPRDFFVYYSAKEKVLHTSLDNIFIYIFIYYNLFMFKKEKLGN